MKNTMSLSVMLVICSLNANTKAEEIGSGFCKDLELSNIPIGDFSDTHMPMETMRITQHYNTSYSEGWCSVGGSQPDATSSACDGQTIYYGHDGLDLHPQNAQAGATAIFSIQEGKVIASHKNGSFGGWGESMIIGTRANQYSEEILTFHYHHLYYDANNETTTRLYNACDLVQRGAEIAREGGSPNWPSHLHLSVKRWDNIQELKDIIEDTPSQFYGSGYVYGSTHKLERFLDPEGLLYDYFQEYTEKSNEYTTWQWSSPYAEESRHRGWFFGEYDGTFGVDKVVSRQFGARLIKQALELETIPMGMVGYFIDVPPESKNFPYINTLSQWPEWIPVINPEHSCTLNGNSFCPESPLTRAAAIKMIVAGFFQEEFLDLYNNWIWKAAAPLASELFSHFQDVVPDRWYAPYVYFAWQKGLTGDNSIFLPNQAIKRGELAKWLVLAYQLTHPEIEAENFCDNVSCVGGFYCEESTETCQPTPVCVPQEGLTCPLGGGHGETSTSPEESNQECSPGDEELALCPEEDAGAYRVCLNSGEWSSWDPPCFEESAGSGGTGGSTGGTGGNTGVGGSGGSSGTKPCETEYYLAPSGASCYSNQTASGSPTLCLEVENPIGDIANWRLCKQGGSFQNSFSFELLDQNHLSQFLGEVKQSSSGTVCTEWSQADVDYLDSTGPINGAGLIVEVKSPSGCTSQACTYYSGITTLYLDCE